MPTAYTSLLGLALPVTGELSGTWGDTVNNYITQYVDAAVAGVQTISGSQTAVTLSVTNGSSLVTAGAGATGSAQFQIINCTGNPAGLLTITTPASSRQYIIINATSTSQSVKIVGTGPTTGVTLVAGEKAHVAWNGSDFVKIATQNGSGDFVTVDTTNLEVTNIKAKDGTASMVLTDSTGAVDISKAVTMSATTQNIALGTSQTSGTFTVGGAAQTGTQTFDQSTKTHTLNLGTGATENTLTKTINLGTAGVSGSTTTITVGSTNGTTTTLNGTVTAATLNSTTIDTTNIEVTNIKAKDGTAAIVLTDSTGAVGISTAVTMSATTQNIALGTSQTTGTFTVGGAAQTGIQTFDQSTKTHTLNLGTGATENTLTKTINIGTAGVSGSTTSIAIGSTNGTTTTINGAITASATTQNISLGASQTTGTFAAGGAAQTGTLTFDPSTKTHTLNIGTGATESAATKTINLGTAGVATSTTAINIGSTNGTTITLNGTVNATTLDLTNIEVTNIKAKDGTASMTLADTTGIITLSATAGTANGVAYLNGSRALTTGSALTFDGTKLGVASGNIDVVSASFVGSPLIAARFNASNFRMGIGIGNSNGFPFLGANVNNAANDNGTFDINGYASRIRLDNGVFQVQTSSASGTAGNAITWTTPLYLEADGDLGIGTTSPGTKLDVVGAGAVTSGTMYSTIITRQDTTTKRGIFLGYDSSGQIGVIGTDSAGAAASIAFWTYNGSAWGERMRLDSSGNLGLGVTPSAWGGNYKGFQVNSTGALASNGSNATGVGHNYFFDGTNNRYLTTGSANLYLMFNNEHRWYNAASGTANSASVTSGASYTVVALGSSTLAQWQAFFNDSSNNPLTVTPTLGQVLTGNATGTLLGGGLVTQNISFTQAMTLDASGRLLVKATSNTGTNTKLAVGSGLTSANAVAVISTEDVDVDGVQISNWTGSATTKRVSLGFDSSGVGGFRIGIPGGVNAFQIYDAVAATERARISSDGTFRVKGAGTAGSTDAVQFSGSAPASSLILDSSGRLGVGETSPGQPLVVSKNQNASTWTQVSNTTSGSGAAAGVLLTSDSSIQATLELDSTGYATYGNMLRLRQIGAYPIGFFTSDTERARITSGGYFKASNAGTYVGSTGAYHELVSSEGSATAAVYIRNTNASSPAGIDLSYSAASPNGTGNPFLYCQDSTALRASIRSNGGLANYQANDVNLSDMRAKKDVVPAPSYWDKIKGIEIVHFKYKDQTHDDNNVGVIAQQVEQVAPEFVDQDGWGETPEDGVPLKSIYTSDMYHAAIKTLQEAMTRIEKLEAEVAALKGA